MCTGAVCTHTHVHTHMYTHTHTESPLFNHKIKKNQVSESKLLSMSKGSSQKRPSCKKSFPSPAAPKAFALPEGASSLGGVSGKVLLVVRGVFWYVGMRSQSRTLFTSASGLSVSAGGLGSVGVSGGNCACACGVCC